MNPNEKHRDGARFVLNPTSLQLLQMSSDGVSDVRQDPWVTGI